MAAALDRSGPGATRGALAGGAILTALLLLVEFAPIPGTAELLRRLDAIWYDTRLNLTLADAAPPRDVIIVDIDEASLSRVGRWPWPRERIARLTGRIAATGAAVIAFDMVFPEPEENPATRVTAAAAAAGYALPDFAPLLAALDGDTRLAGALQAAATDADVVLGAFIDVTRRSIGVLGPTAIQAATPLPASLRSFRGHAGNLPQFVRHATTGFITTVPDRADGVVRAAPLVSRYGDRLYPSLALEAARRWLLYDTIVPETARSAGGTVLTGLNLDGQVRLATDPAGRVAVPYRGPRRTFHSISAADLLFDTLTPAERASLAGTVAMVGTSAIGLADLVVTPTGSSFPGVEVHASVAQALIDAGRDPGRAVFPHRPDWVPGALLVATVLTGFTVAWLGAGLGPAGLVTLGVVAAAALALANVLAWQRLRLDLPLVALLLLVLLITLAALVRGYLREAGTRRAMREMFDQYVPPAHVERILAEREAVSFAGETREMTVLFSDIRDFTSISEHLEAAQLKQLLNTFFTPVTETIFEHSGTIDKYVGDMVMAFWNAPLADADHREHAIRAALEMLAIVRRLREELQRRGLPTVSIGIGINTGMMNVGDMGSQFRRAYTVMGDAVNLGSRIEGITKRYGVPLLVGEGTRDGCDAFLYRFVDRVRVKGKQQGVRLYEPLALLDSAPPELVARVMRYHSAYWLFAGQEWDRAAAAFDALIADEPDTLLYRVYRQRIEQLRTLPLPEDWDATEVLTEK